MADAVAVHCRPLEETRGPNSSCQWLAECDVDGRRFTARSRQGAVYELARTLVAAGIEDRPLCVTFARVAGEMTWGSFAAAARSTLTEGAATPLRRRGWRNFDAKLGRMGQGKRVEFSASFSPREENTLKKPPPVHPRGHFRKSRPVCSSIPRLNARDANPRSEEIRSTAGICTCSPERSAACLDPVPHFGTGAPWTWTYDGSP
jgi:hypothetical protein